MANPRGEIKRVEEHRNAGCFDRQDDALLHDLDAMDQFRSVGGRDFERRDHTVKEMREGPWQPAEAVFLKPLPCPKVHKLKRWPYCFVLVALVRVIENEQKSDYDGQEGKHN